MASFSSEILLPFPNSNDLNSRGAKYKEKLPNDNVSDPNQNVKTTYNSKLKFT